MPLTAVYSRSTAENLTKDPMDVVNRIDYILFMLDMTNRDSLAIFRDALEQIPPALVYSKCGIVFTRGERSNLWILVSY